MGTVTFKLGLSAFGIILPSRVHGRALHAWWLIVAFMGRIKTRGRW